MTTKDIVSREDKLVVDTKRHQLLEGLGPISSLAILILDRHAC